VDIYNVLVVVTIHFIRFIFWKYPNVETTNLGISTFGRLAIQAFPVA